MAKPSVALIGIILALAGCVGIPDHHALDLPGAACDAYAGGEQTSLADKAKHFDKLLDRFISPEGLLLYKQPYAADGFVYATLADACAWTGALLAAESMRYGVTEDRRAYARIVRLLEGLALLQRVTGEAGLYARSLWVADAPGILEHKATRRGLGPYAAYSYRGDLSKDQLCGLILGLTAAWKLAPTQEVHALVKAQVVALADHLLHYNYVLHQDGSATTFGNVRGRIVGVPIGINAMVCLAVMRLAQKASGHKRFSVAYDDLVARRYAEIAAYCKVQVFYKTNHSNDNMQYMLATALFMLDPDERLLAGVRSGVERTWRHVRLEGNSWFTYASFNYLGIDPETAKLARLSLERFPLTRRQYGVDLRGDPRLAHLPLAPFTTRKGEPRLKWALPLSYRCVSTFAWKSCPYTLVSHAHADGSLVFAPTDYLIAYWSGRLWGYLDEQPRESEQPKDTP